MFAKASFFFSDSLRPPRRCVCPAQFHLHGYGLARSPAQSRLGNRRSTRPAFRAGFAEGPGSAAGRGGLSYGLRHAAQEVTAITVIADDVYVSESAGKGEQRGLCCHWEMYLLTAKVNTLSPAGLGA